jgi:4-hydroxy-3-polyprenylbenzoate decarboxylase
MNLGSKMIVDATMKQQREKRKNGEKDKGERILARLQKEYSAIREARVHDEALMLVKVAGEGRKTVESLVRIPELNSLKIIAAVSEDVDLNNQESYIWGVFTRFDCERDVIFSEQSLLGISPIYRGVMGIDATWKTGYPAPLVMREEIREKVNRRWEEYWR